MRDATDIVNYQISFSNPISKLISLLKFFLFQEQKRFFFKENWMRRKNQKKKIPKQSKLVQHPF